MLSRMIIRTTIDLVIPENDPRVQGKAKILLTSEGDRGKYFKPFVNCSSTENESLRFVSIEQRNDH